METQNFKPVAVSTVEAAKMLGISKPSIYRLIHRGDFPVLRVGGRTLISVAGLDQWVEQQTKKEDESK